MTEMEYDDGLVALSADALIIRRYDLFLRPKRVAYAKIRAVTQVELRGFRFGNWRLWGSSDLRHWFNLDWRRPKKRLGLVLENGQRVKPVVTPDETQRVVAVLRSHGVEVTQL